MELTFYRGENCIFDVNTKHMSKISLSVNYSQGGSIKKYFSTT